MLENIMRLLVWMIFGACLFLVLGAIEGIVIAVIVRRRLRKRHNLYFMRDVK